MRLTLGTANFLKNYSLIQKDNLNSLYKKMQNSNNPYGDGKASYRIVDFFKKLIQS